MREKGFVIVENVCNVVISGYEQGSHIECSHGAGFRFYFKNVINVTITGLRITNCGIPVPHYLEATFSDNSASNGGALSLISSVLHVSPNAVVNFTRNHATGLGGAVYIILSNPRTNIVCDALTSTASSCSIQVFNKSPNECDLFALHFNQNTAGIAGGAMYVFQAPAKRSVQIVCSPMPRTYSNTMEQVIIVIYPISPQTPHECVSAKTVSLTATGSHVM